MRILLFLALGFLLYQLVKRMMVAKKSPPDNTAHIPKHQQQSEVPSDKTDKKNPDLDYSTVREARYRDLDDEQP